MGNLFESLKRNGY